jgi:hypothetical protein
MQINSQVKIEESPESISRRAVGISDYKQGHVRPQADRPPQLRHERRIVTNDHPLILKLSISSVAAIACVRLRFGSAKPFSALS